MAEIVYADSPPIMGTPVGYGLVLGQADSAAPVISVVSPAVGTAITSSTSLVIDVTDGVSLGIAILWVAFPGRLAPELIHDGDAFSAAYVGSTRTVVAGGYRYSLTRVGGWPGSPSVYAKAIDSQGNRS